MILMLLLPSLAAADHEQIILTEEIQAYCLNNSKIGWWPEEEMSKYATPVFKEFEEKIIEDILGDETYTVLDSFLDEMNATKVYRIGNGPYYLYTGFQWLYYEPMTNYKLTEFSILIGNLDDDKEASKQVLCKNSAGYYLTDVGNTSLAGNSFLIRDGLYAGFVVTEETSANENWP